MSPRYVGIVTTSKGRGIERPVLLFKEGSSGFLHKIIDVLDEEFPDSRVKTPLGGHAPQLGSMEEFIEILDAFHAGSS